VKDYVLVVDDEESVRRMMRRWLEDAGQACREAADAQQALDVMAQAPAAVAFCDVQMPGKDGIWLTGELRARYKATAVVLATGVSTVPARVSMMAGVMAYLVKPIQRAAVLSALDMAMQWHRDTMLRGADPRDSGDRLADWLDELREL
jgi:DNA-binding NtrC family response regulator